MKLFVKVGSEEARGPLDVADVRAALDSGVLPPTALAGPTLDDLRPIGEVLFKTELDSREKHGKRTRLILLVSAIVVAVLAIGGGSAFYVLTRPPPLCPATSHILARLQKRLTIRLFVSHDVKTLALESKKIESLLARMKAASGGNMTYEVINVRDEASRAKAMEAGLQQVTSVDGIEAAEGSDNGADVHVGFLGLVFLYGNEQDKIPLLPSADGVEFWIDNKIREISAKSDHTSKHVGIVAGHHEVSIADPYLVGSMAGQRPTLKSIITQYFPFYEIVDVDAHKPIPNEIDGLMITSPTDDYTDDELHAIDDYVMRGKALVVVASAGVTKASDPTMTVRLSTHGLEKLTGGYGLELDRDLVFDGGDHAYKVSIAGAGTGAGTMPLSSFFIPRCTDKSGLDATHPIAFRIPEAYFPLASSISKHEERQPGARFRVFAKSSPTALRDTRDTLTVSPLHPTKPEGPTGEVILAASVEGTLSSAFGKGKSAGPARVAVIASSLFFENPFARAGSPPDWADPPGLMMPQGGDESLDALAMPYAQVFATTGILMFKNTIDWLTFEEDMTSCLDFGKPDDKKTHKK